MKYPLTDRAKELARKLVDAWRTGQINQHLHLINVTGLADRTIRFSFMKVDPGVDLELDFGMIKELSIYGLIYLSGSLGTGPIEVVLLQELRNAVETDFEVSEYFLTMNAVGTIVQGDLNMQPGSVLQSAASNTGNITQNAEQIADNLSAMLGEDFLQSQAELRAAIEALREATAANQASKLGRVVSELGRCLGHGANTAVVVGAISALAAHLQTFA